ncbi:S-layer homology domain-containing protein [Paenibacillus sp. GYB004]|uniref:S-layer homology domain-containing protein n=1 Tax=Paenibacillus sp. GYB004 TaxID=2994393 RepID=UPI002F96E065
MKKSLFDRNYKKAGAALLLIGGGIALFKKSAIVTAFAAVLASGSVSAANPITFSDLNGHWSSESVAAAIEKGYVDGYEDQTFRPDVEVSRAEFIKMIVASSKLPVKAPVENEEWYLPFYNAAVSKGIVTNGDFPKDKLNVAISRADMAKLSLRASNEKLLSKELVDGEAMYESTKTGLIQGMDDRGTLAPEGQTTRAQSVTIIQRVLDLHSGKALATDKYAISQAEIEWHKTNIFTMLPQYFLKGYLLTGKKLDVSKLRYEGENGYSEVEKYVVIDLDDPNDPNRGLIPENVQWRLGGGINGPINEWPTDAYALISVNRLVVNSPTDVETFRASGIYASFSGQSEELKAAGKPWKLGYFSEYYPKYRAIYQASVFDVKAGYNDIRYIYGQFIPKGVLTAPDGQNNMVLYNRSATELGQPSSSIAVYGSPVDYSLVKE